VLRTRGSLLSPNEDIQLAETRLIHVEVMVWSLAAATQSMRHQRLSLGYFSSSRPCLHDLDSNMLTRPQEVRC